MIWGDGDLQYLLNVQGNTFVQTGGDEGDGHRRALWACTPGNGRRAGTEGSDCRLWWYTVVSPRISPIRSDCHNWGSAKKLGAISEIGECFNACCRGHTSVAFLGMGVVPLNGRNYDLITVLVQLLDEGVLGSRRP